MATIVIDSWSDVGLSVNLNAQAVKTTCPSCSEKRKNKREKCLSINPAKGVANCHNCGDNFVIRSENRESFQSKEWKLPEVTQLPLSAKSFEFFKKRGIENRVLEYFKITESNEWMPGRKADESKGQPEYKEGNTACMNFNYFDGVELVNVKFRAPGKRFKMSSGAKLIFYNLDAIKDSTECSIQEGEIDTMTAYQCSLFSCVSVPNGASKGNMRLEYLDNCIEHFENKTKIIIATDGDEAGLILRDELIRRLGRERCWVIDYPEGTKDTNEILLKYGEDKVRQVYANARQLPIEGIVSGEELQEEIIDIYENGYPKGVSIGYSEFDRLFTWSPGQLTMLTGIPGHGKSEFMDQIMVRLSARYGWRHAVFAPENEPKFQASALISKFVGGEMIGSGQINEMKRDKGIQFIKDHFFFMKVDEIDVTIDGILDVARELVVKKGVNLLLIDPYNYIESKLGVGQSETLYISELLTKIVKFSKVNQVHTVLVAHPTKIMRDKKTDKYVVPRLYDIAGCHDDQTEVLTSRGWVKHEDIEPADTVACYDLSNNNIEYLKPTHYHKYPYKGDLIHFSGRSMDIAVTPNHRMILKPHWTLKPETIKQTGRAKKYNSRGWQFINADDVSKSPTIMPKSGEVLHMDLLPDEFPLDNGYRTNHLFSLIGWFVSEGCESQRSISICQRVESSKNLKRVISDLRLQVKETETNYLAHEKPMYTVRLYAKKHPELVRFILDECRHGSQNVKLPSIVWDGNEYQKRLLFDAMIEGDGSISGKGYKYHTCSQDLADDMSRLAFELGFSVAQRKYEKKKSHWMDRYVVYINPKKTEWIMPVNHHSFFYDGFVYCLTVPTGAYVTRRNGNVAITGNSANFFNKTYNGICVYRDYEEKITTVHVQKFKYKWGGGVGSCDFIYDFPTGRFAHLSQPFENELDRFLSKESQVMIPFEPPEPGEPGMLTDIYKMPSVSSFDFKKTDDVPF